MYLWTTIVFFLIGGLFALLLRLELLSPQARYFSNHAYNVFFTLHGAMMIFLFIIPAIPSGLGNFFIPLHLGARDVAFPRLNLASYWVFVAGFLVIIGSLVAPMDTGWTFYTPYSAKSAAAVTTISLGLFLVGLSSILTGLNFIVTIHKLRAPGMTWHRMPLFLWSCTPEHHLWSPRRWSGEFLLISERCRGGVLRPGPRRRPCPLPHFSGSTRTPWST